MSKRTIKAKIDSRSRSEIPARDRIQGWNMVIHDVSSMGEQERSALLVYVKAHEILSPRYVFDGSLVATAMVDGAARAMEKKDADDETLLGSIVLLGHSPCRRSVEALKAFTEGGHRFAAIAHFALAECMQLYMNPYAGVVPEVPSSALPITGTRAQ